jgi:hypothetical protein
LPVLVAAHELGADPVGLPLAHHGADVQSAVVVQDSHLGWLLCGRVLQRFALDELRDRLRAQPCRLVGSTVDADLPLAGHGHCRRRRGVYRRPVSIGGLLAE